jgi:uncharacterized protein (DUF305 family)
MRPPPTPPPGNPRRLGAALRWTAALAAVLLAGYTLGVWRATPDMPDEGSADVGFVRDMTVHHAQAVTLAMLALDRATAPALREMAEEIVTTQQREIGVMAGWLDQWGLPATSATAPMSWMTHGASAASADEPMPGMATRREVAQFAVARGPEADRRFCELMVAHHLGGLHMIEEIMGRGTRAEVKALAGRMRADQLRELELLHSALGARRSGRALPATG